MSTTTLIIGSSRGIGQELTRQLSSNPSNTIYATIRSEPAIAPSSAPAPTTTNIKYLKLDLSQPSTIDGAAETLNTNDYSPSSPSPSRSTDEENPSSPTPKIDTLVLSAAIGSNESMLDTTPDRLMTYLSTNVVGVHRVVRAFLPALRRGKGKKIVFVSSTSGSLGRQVGGQMGFRGPYSVAKAAGNMLMIQLHNELKDEGFTVVCLHPGWVATDMGNSFADGGMDAETSVNGMLKVIDGLTVKDSGTFLQWDGQTVEW